MRGVGEKSAAKGGVPTFEKTAMKSDAMALSTRALTDMICCGEEVGVERKEPIVKVGCLGKLWVEWNSGREEGR